MTNTEGGSPHLMERLGQNVLAELNAGMPRTDREALGLTLLRHLERGLQPEVYSRIRS